MILRRLLTLILCFMTTTVFANTRNELQLAFQELNYDLTTEWDQKDKTVLSAKLERFQAVIAGLRSKGASNEELSSALKELVKNPELLSRFEFLASMNMLDSDKNLTEFIWKNRQDMGAQGASWNGSTQTFVVGGIVAVVIATIVVLITKIKYVCTSETEYYCEERWTCTEPNSEWGCQDGYYYEWCGTTCLAGHNEWQ